MNVNAREVSRGFGLNLKQGNKRKAELSPTKKVDIKAKKRSALGDLTNAAKKAVANANANNKKLTQTRKVERIQEEAPIVCRTRAKSLRRSEAAGKNENIPEVNEPENQPTACRTRSKSLTNKSQGVLTTVSDLNKKAVIKSKIPAPNNKRTSKLGGEKNEVVEDSLLYSTALQTPDSEHIENQLQLNLRNIQLTDKKKATFPDGVPDFDEECGNDPFQVGIYAQDIFNYYFRREVRFPVKKYLEKQTELNKNMRSILVDWMVEVQENFELNHETLYMAVKLVDLFLGKVLVKRDKLQLVGTTALYVASKFDERSPPIIDDFCYICDDAYPQEDIIRMETRLLKALNFDIGFPLSYRFLRRFARCGKIEMSTLYLARFILEICLMEYDFIDTKDSLMASSALYLAMTLKKEGTWTPTLEFYSGYKSDDLFDLTHRLYNYVRSLPAHLKTIKAKYSHKIFHEASKTAIPDELHL